MMVRGLGSSFMEKSPRRRWNHENKLCPTLRLFPQGMKGRGGVEGPKKTFFFTAGQRP